MTCGKLKRVETSGKRWVMAFSSIRAITHQL
jgi:hypothetical protein